MSAKRKGDEVRETTSIRLEPSKKKEIIQIFGSVQSWIDLCLKVLNETKGEKK